MIQIKIDKLYKYPRINEPCFIGFPLPQGKLRDPGGVTLYADADANPSSQSDDPAVTQGKNFIKLPVQAKATGLYEDGSVRFLFLRFLVDIPANKGAVVFCDLGDDPDARAFNITVKPFVPVSVSETDTGYIISTKTTGINPDSSGANDADPSDSEAFFAELKNNSDEIFESITAGMARYSKSDFTGPALVYTRKITDPDPDLNDPGTSLNPSSPKQMETKPESALNRKTCSLKLDSWEIVEAGPVCAILKTTGTHIASRESRSDKKGAPETNISCEIRLTFWSGRPEVEVSYRIINTTPDPVNIDSLIYSYLYRPHQGDPAEKKIDSASPQMLHRDSDDIRTCVASSNYKTNFNISETGETVQKHIDADWLINEANEHFAEVFYGTFFADHTAIYSTGKTGSTSDTESGGLKASINNPAHKNGYGLCATIFQAHQNYPKALESGRDGIRIMLVPETSDGVTMQSGMAREQRFLLHFHDAETALDELNDRSIVYQMPYRPYVSPRVHRESGVWPDIFPDKTYAYAEQNLIARADGHCRAYGMMNFGDSYDSNYTAQGRGGGKLVWCNNEYDYPHSCALLYARTGISRFLDYNIASCSHWMDVDVCHFHTDPLYMGGQWEHSASHILGGVMVCSHQWVEGLLDYYHFTGDERGLSTAIGIGENVQRLLDTPAYAKVGEANARETGWALRTLTALYIETLDKSWLVKCDRIVNDFKVWEETYGYWLAPYTDNTLIRVGFMISVAIGSLMRYYRIFPNEEIKGMILRAVDDLIENCYVPEWGIFYYKELPSLNRLGNNTLLLEALTAAYDLSGDSKYLEYGIETFKNAMSDTPGYNSTKRKIEDTVLVGNMSSKNFAQSMIPLSGYYRAISGSGIDIT